MTRLAAINMKAVSALLNAMQFPQGAVGNCPPARAGASPVAESDVPLRYKKPMRATPALRFGQPICGQGHEPQTSWRAPSTASYGASTSVSPARDRAQRPLLEAPLGGGVGRRPGCRRSCPGRVPHERGLARALFGWWRGDLLAQ